MATDDSLVSLLSTKEKGGSGGDGQEPMKKRTCLRQYDLLPAQVLNSMGQSGIESVGLEKLWDVMAQGNKACVAFSNLSMKGKDRQNVGLSQACEAMSVAIQRFRDSPESELVIKPDLLSKAKIEADLLLPHLKVLNLGKHNSATSNSIKSVAYLQSSAAIDIEKLKESAAFLYDWLQSASTLRSLLAYLSGAGSYYVAQCHEKSLRAYVAHGISSKEAMTMVAASRCGAASSGNAPDEMGGLR